MLKRALSLSFLVLSQHEQFYPEGLPVFAPFRHLRMVRANLGNSQNNSLNLVCPRFKRETEGGVHLVCGQLDYGKQYQFL